MNYSRNQLGLTNFFGKELKPCSKCNSAICSCDLEIPKRKIEEWTGKFHLGNTLELSKQLPDESIDMVITSPPYYGLRNYNTEPQIWDDKKECEHEFQIDTKKYPMDRGGQGQHDSDDGISRKWEMKKMQSGFCKHCGAWKGELGSEPSPDLFISHLVDIFMSLKPKLKKSGSLYVNLGDSYSGSGYCSPEYNIQESSLGYKKVKEGVMRSYPINWKKIDISPKSLMLIPHRFAIKMQENEWILRNSIVWYKPNHMPTSVQDRFANAHEYIFFFTKSRKYYFDLYSIKEPFKNSTLERVNYEFNPSKSDIQGSVKFTGQRSFAKKILAHTKLTSEDYEVKGMISYGKRMQLEKEKFFENFPKNPNSIMRLNTLSEEEKNSPFGATPSDVFEVNTMPYEGAHFACYPINLLERPIKASCPKEICKRCGTPRFPVLRRGGIKYNEVPYRPGIKSEMFAEMNKSRSIRQVFDSFGTFEYHVDYTKCDCNDGFESGIVLDPFAGSGTTIIASEMHGRRWIGFDLKPEYITMSEKRLAEYHESLKFKNIEDFNEIQKLKRDAEKTKQLGEFL